MWSFATHAGAGMAIAGLTATYYALSRRNYQVHAMLYSFHIPGERERMAHESGFGDGPQVNRLRKHSEIGQLNSSHMLLKKELEELSVLNGSSSGLNILYQQKTPLHRFQQSNFEISPIVSRVDTRPSAVYLKESEEEVVGAAPTTSTAADGDESVFGSDPNVDNGENGGISPKSDIESDDLLMPPPPTTDSIEKNKAVPLVNVDEGASGDVTNEKSDNPNSNPVPTAAAPPDNANSTINDDEPEGKNVSEPKKTESVSEKWKAVQDNQFLKRTTSPICFFKNPGFGKRYAATTVTEKKKKEKSSPLVATLSSSNVNVACEGQSTTIAAKTVPDSPSNKECQASTEVLLSPTLGKSTVSVCEAENLEKLLKPEKKKKKAITPEAKNVEQIFENSKTLSRSKNMEVDPGIRLRADPKNSNLSAPPKTRTKLALASGSPNAEDYHCNGDGESQRADEEKSEQVEDTKKPTPEPVDTGPRSSSVLPLSSVACEESEELFQQQQEEKEEVRIPFPTKPNPSIQVITRPSALVTHIPRDSWISLPVRFYTNTVEPLNLPWSLIGVCLMVVIIAGFVGMFLTRLANNIQRRRMQDGMP